MCVWQLPARRVFNTRRVGKCIIFHTLVVGTVWHILSMNFQKNVPFNSQYEYFFTTRHISLRPSFSKQKVTPNLSKTRIKNTNPPEGRTTNVDLSLQEHSWRFIIRHYPAFLQGEKLALLGPVLPPLARNKKVTFYLARWWYFFLAE